MKKTEKENIITRMFQGDEDFWQIRQLPVDTFATTPPGWNWDFRRWDGSRFYDSEPAIDPRWYQAIRLWKTTDGQLAGLVNSYAQGWFALQLYPQYRGMLEEEMITWAENHLAVVDKESGQAQIHTEVFDYDLRRTLLLKKRGYQKLPNYGVFRMMNLEHHALPEVTVPDGYIMRPINAAKVEECQKLADLLNAAFNRNFHQAGEFFQFARQAPSFRPDLHLVMEAPDGSFAAHVAAIFDDENHYAFYEPVCTHPEHRQKKLAQTLMFELMHRLRDLGAVYLSVETGDMDPANKLYDSIGFTEIYYAHVWRKQL